jgi:xylitol oxidase
VKQGTWLKALARGAFNGIGDSVHRLLVMTGLNRVVALDAARHRVTVEGGITYGELSRYLGEQGFALHNLASLPHVSVAGACATATHGSGVTNRNLADAVLGLEMVIADGSVVTLSADSDRERLNGAVVNLSALGVVTKVTLAIEPAYSMRQEVFEGLQLRQFTEHLDTVMSAGYSVSLFTAV